MAYVPRRKLRGQESLDDLHADTNLVSLPGRPRNMCGTTVDRLIAQYRMARSSTYRHHTYACKTLMGYW